MNKSIIVDWIINNQEYLQELIIPLTKDYLIELETSPEWKDVIIKQYDKEVKELIIIEAGKSLALPAIDLIDCLEEVDITHYLGDEW